eukprot:306368-Amphidinium_carterae.1
MVLHYAGLAPLDHLGADVQRRSKQYRLESTLEFLAKGLGDVQSKLETLDASTCQWLQQAAEHNY